MAVPLEQGIQVTDDDSMPDDAYPDLSSTPSGDALSLLIELTVAHGFFRYDDDFLNDHIKNCGLEVSCARR